MTAADDSGYLGLVARLGESGALGEGWRGAFLRTPRGRFIPERIWIEEGPDGYRSVTRAADPGRWQTTVDADGVVVTQLDDGADDGPRIATSSASMPTLVARMLEALEVGPGGSVLEIGTGTGWSTALLCARLGGHRVVSIEVDASVAARGRASLEAAGHRPTLVVGDGTGGWPKGAPYDRVISTAAVARVPDAWPDQCVPGGIVVTPWGTPFCNAGLLKLRVREGGGAVGRFVGSVNFMWVRGQRPLAARHGGREEGRGAEPRFGPSAMCPRLALESVHAAFAIGLRVPDVRYREVWNSKDPEATRRLVLWDAGGSRADVFLSGWEEADAVRQAGPRNLWDEVTAARAWWEGRGRPELTRFGVTVAPGVQEVWLDRPGDPL